MTNADTTGWYEFISADKAATTHVAYVYEDGTAYLPDGMPEEAFQLASATDRIWKLVPVGPDPRRECARLLMALVDSGKSWLQDVNGVETAVIGVTDASKLLSGFSS